MLVLAAAISLDERVTGNGGSSCKSNFEGRREGSLRVGCRVGWRRTVYLATFVRQRSATFGKVAVSLDRVAVNLYRGWLTPGDVRTDKFQA